MGLHCLQKNNQSNYQRKTIFLLFGVSVFFSQLISAQKIKLIDKNLKSEKTIVVEIANTDSLRTNGLMNRKSLGKDNGMIFIFPDEAHRAFWMKNTLIPLSIGYYSKERKLLEILDMAATTLNTKEFLRYPSTNPAKYALEMNMGWFKTNKIGVGSTLEFIGKEPAGL